MKTKDVQIGSEYLTRVSGTLVKVRVTGKESTAWGANPRRTEFTIVRVDNGRRLESRSAAALRPVPEKKPQAKLYGNEWLTLAAPTVKKVD